MRSRDLALPAQDRMSQKPSQADDFLNWLKEPTLRFRKLYVSFFAIPGLIALATFLANFFGIPVALREKYRNLEMNDLISIEMFLQCLIVFTMYWFIPHPADVDWEEAKKKIEERLRTLGLDMDLARSHNASDYQKAHEVTKQFSARWELAWLSWALLYLVWGSIHLMASINNEIDITTWQASITFIFNLNTLAMYICYRELIHPVPIWAPDQRKNLCGFLFAIIAISSIQFFGAYTESNSWIFIGSIAGAVANFGAGAALALLIGRLESRLISPPGPIIYLLYMYAIMQGSVPFIENSPALLLALSSLALCLKIVLFMLIAWLLQSGVLTFYLAELKALEEKNVRIKRGVTAHVLQVLIVEPAALGRSGIEGHGLLANDHTKRHDETLIDRNHL